MTYREKLQDPRWQKIRLKVFERDGFKCVACRDGNKTLHVHHLAYHPEPWESELDELQTLCETCHENVELTIKMVRENAHIRALPHIINRTVQLHDKGAGWPESLLKCALSLAREAGEISQEEADEAAARTREH